MYRARAESVSGIHVYADGKWLRSIGNKKVNVGDYVWTDGRCVYGNNRISQQPIIANAPEEISDEGIPIILLTSRYAGNNKYQKFEEFYTFSKGHLKLIREIQIESSDVDFDDYMMINDSKKQVLVTEKNYYDIGKNLIATLLATNITAQGDKFDMVQIHELIPINPGSHYNYIVYKEILIRKNGNTVQVIDIDSIANEIVGDCPDFSEALPFVIGEVSDFQIYGPFIEDENNWRFQFEGSLVRSYTDEYTGPYPESGLDPTAIYGNTSECCGIQRHILISSHGKTILRDNTYKTRLDEIVTQNVTMADFDNIKFSLQDGYYYKLRPIGTTAYNDPLFVLALFSPKGNEIFSSEIFPSIQEKYFLINHGSPISLTYINGGYLFSFGYGWGTNGESVYVIKNSIASPLLKGRCLNQRLRSMKHTKNWIKLIQQLTF